MLNQVGIDRDSGTGTIISDLQHDAESQLRLCRRAERQCFLFRQKTFARTFARGGQSELILDDLRARSHAKN
jgi:hypothetical protein